MKVYAAVDDPRLPLRDVAAYAQRAERLGFHGLLIPEAVHDGFLASLLALEHTRSLRVTTSVALAFPRSPTVTAYAAWDLQSLSGGRFELGLGSQVKGNITGRYGVAWTPPVPRMRDYVGAVRAVWRTWQTGEKLDFNSANYRLDRMQPFFNPGPIEHPDIPVLLGGVNPLMTRLAGEIADGLMTHPTNSNPRFLREVTLPELERGRAKGRPDGARSRLIASTFVATGRTTTDVQTERERLRQHLGFLYSTPQYWRTLELFGWNELGPRLHEMSRSGNWTEMFALITDEVFDALVPSGTYTEIEPTLREWYGTITDGITLRMPDDPAADAALADLLRKLAE